MSKGDKRWQACSISTYNNNPHTPSGHTTYKSLYHNFSTWKGWDGDESLPFHPGVDNPVTLYSHHEEVCTKSKHTNCKLSVHTTYNPCVTMSYLKEKDEMEMSLSCFYHPVDNPVSLYSRHEEVHTKSKHTNFKPSAHTIYNPSATMSYF